MNIHSLLNERKARDGMCAVKAMTAHAFNTIKKLLCIMDESGSTFSPPRQLAGAVIQEVFNIPSLSESKHQGIKRQ